MHRLTIVAICVVAAQGFAQDSKPVNPGVRPARFCLIARPQLRCANYLITELSAATTLLSTRTFFAGFGDNRKDFVHRFNLALGGARNRGTRTSIGGAVIINLLHDEPFGGVEMRHRRWFGSGTRSLELSAGYSQAAVWAIECYTDPTQGEVCRGNSSSDNRVLGRGLRAGAAFNPTHHLGLFTRGELLRSRGRQHGGLFVGAHGGPQESIIAIGAFIILGMYAMSQL